MVKILSIVTAVICSMFFHASSEAKTSVPLSFFTQSEDGIVWSWFNPTNNNTQLIDTFEERPAALYWEKDGKTIRVIDQGRISSFSGSGIRLKETQIALPQMLAQEKPVALWRDDDDHTLRIATWIIVKPEQVQDNSIHLNDSISVPAMTDPEWGWHAVVRLFKQDGDTWMVEHTRATKSEAGDTPGLSVLKPFWNEQGASDLQLASQKYCGRYGSVFMGRRCDDGHIDVNIRNAFYDFAFPSCKRTKGGYLHAKDCGAVSSGFVTCEDCKFDLVHSTQEGDSLHAVFPAFLRDKKTGKHKQLSLSNNGQLWADTKGKYAFIESKAGLAVIDLMTGKVLLNTKGEEAFWLPN